MDLDKLTLESRNRLSISSVSSVDGFCEQYIKLTVNGCKVIINGEKLKITAYNKGSGVMSAEGLVNEIKYNAKKQPLLKRIFK